MSERDPSPAAAENPQAAESSSWQSFKTHVKEFVEASPEEHKD